MCPAFHDGDEVLEMVVIHVDDILFGGLKCIGEFVVQALGDSPDEELGRSHFFLGCAFRRDREAGTIEISQELHSECT